MVSEEKDTSISRDNFISTNGKHCSLTPILYNHSYTV